MPTESLARLQQRLMDQGAVPSHLKRIADLRALCEADPSCVAVALVGSFAKGCADRISDLDLAAFTRGAGARDFIDRADRVLASEPVLDKYCGGDGHTASFRKYVYLDFASCELTAFNVPTTFKLRRPYLPVWDPSDFLASCEVPGPTPRHEDFEPYQHGDDGLIWELVDCIKWLKRGRVDLAKDYLRRLAVKLR